MSALPWAMSGGTPARLLPTAAPAGVGDPARSWPVGPPRAWVAQMSRSLEFYLELGCEVQCAADGWALLRSGPTSFVLIQAPDRTDVAPLSVDGPTPQTAWVRLTTQDVPALRWRLLAEGVAAGRVTVPGHTAEIEVTDPDLHQVVIAQPPGGGPHRRAVRRPARRPRARPEAGDLILITTPPEARG